MQNLPSVRQMPGRTLTLVFKRPSHTVSVLLPASLMFSPPSFPTPWQGYDISFAVTEDHDVLSWGSKGTGATGHRLGTGAFDDDDDDLYKEPRPIRDLMGEEICQVWITRPCGSSAVHTTRGATTECFGVGFSAMAVPLLYNPHKNQSPWHR